MNGAAVPSKGSPGLPPRFPVLVVHTPPLQEQLLTTSSAESNGSPPAAHSVALSIPPISQSIVAIGLVGLAVIKAHISTPAAAKAAQSSSAGSAGSSPAAHSVALSIPPPSQSIVAIGDVGFASINAQMSVPAAINSAQSHASPVIVISTGQPVVGSVTVIVRSVPSAPPTIVKVVTALYAPLAGVTPVTS